jgi:hypothetical protein
MWCRVCRQDVPSVAPQRTDRPTCPRCGGGLALPSRDGGPTGLTSVSDRGVDLGDQRFRELAPAAVPFDREDWRLAQQMRWVRRLAAAPAGPTRRACWDPQHVVGYDTAHRARSEAPPAAVESAVADPASGPAPRAPIRGAGLAWLVLATGVAATACGGLLVARGLFADRFDLWSTGVPLMVAGQLALVIGLAVRLATVTRATQPTADASRSPESTPVAKTNTCHNHRAGIPRGCGPLRRGQHTAPPTPLGSA